MSLSALFISTGFSSQPLCQAAQPPAATAQPDVTQELLQVQQQVKSKEITQQTFEQLARILKQAPQNSQAHLLLVYCYEARGFEDLAEDEYKLSDQYAPQDPASLLSQFQRKVAHRDMYSARSLLVQAQQKYPHDGHTLLMEALFAAYVKQPDKAEAILEKLVRQGDAPPGAASMLAAVRVKQSRYKEAVDLADVDLKQKDDTYLSNASKGVALMQLGQYHAAVPLLKRAFTIGPLEKGIAEDYYGVLLKLGEPSQALKPALVHLACAPTEAEATQARLATAYLLSVVPVEQADATINSVSGLLGSTSYAVRMHFLLGRLLAESGQHRRAIAQLEQGLQLNPNSAGAYFELGQQYEALRDYEDAMVNYTMACGLSPNDPLYTNTMVRLSQRLANRKGDIAWQFKDWLWNHFSKSTT